MSRHLLRKALRLPQAAIKRLVTGLLQLVLLANRPARLARLGFVLPTTVLLVLMLVLTATALTYRSFTRSDMAISQREQQVIANAATPALDRARAKIEFLFNRDNRLSSGLPTGDFLASMMLTEPYPGTVIALPGDPFTLPGETRLDINGDDTLDNAWSFVSDSNSEIITYSILVEDEAQADPDINVQSADLEAKANGLVTRTGPLATTEATTGCANARAEKGWQIVSDGTSTALQKNFQVNVFVPNANDANRTVESFEFQQSRIANRGNKWAAWFRYDMEIFPGAAFNINGAMHTDSSLFFRNNNGQITSYMISSHESCVYSVEASEITVGDTSEDGTFQGQIVRGAIFDNAYAGNNATIHTFSTDNNPPNVRTLTTANDSVNGGNPADVAVNPLVLYTQDRLQHNTAPGAGSWNRVAAWETSDIRTEERILNKRVDRPFVDDFSRADNRWGPKPRYSDTNTALDVTNPANGVRLGDRIEDLDQVTNSITGLDGYWERQAVNYGLRLVVGQRLELGNPNGWNFTPPGVASTQDRLYPPNLAPQPTVGTAIRENEYRQKTALRDNLAAVQSMVVYHYNHPNGGDYPAACMALTAHPGTLQTIRNSRTFASIPGTATLNTNFLNGTGTNGWEFEFYPGTGVGRFEELVNDDTSNLGKALRNLAHFAGDPNGGAPSFNPVQDGVVHPFPYMAMWGDFSPLRRIFDDYLDATTGAVAYADLSSADQATLHSAACTLGMLAFNLQSASNLATVSNLSLAAAALGISNQGQMRTDIAKPVWDAFGGGNSGPVAGSPAQGCVNLGGGNYDCTEVRPTRETLVALAGLTANQIKYVDLIGELTQIDRDRTYGFLQSPATITYGEYEVAKGSSRYRFRFPDNCHPNNPSGPIGPLFDAALGATVQTDERAAIALICATRPKYPSLFYLFPKAAHDQRDSLKPLLEQQPLTEEFIDPARTEYILNADGTTGVNVDVDYEPVEPSDIALAPRLIANWQSPQPGPTLAAATYNPQANHIIGGAGDVREVAFLDKGMFNGREQMGVRVLDIDLKRLTDTTVVGGTDTWLSDIACDPDTQDCDVFTEGIIYAFREDAVREDEIVRPKTSAADSDACLTVANVTSAACHMVTTPGAEADPPLTAAGISLKPVDFFADPDRRPHGFRLRNGADMSRGKTRAVGMTFVTDNSTYVMGNFNLHSGDGTTGDLIEEFEERIGGVAWDMDNFYNDRTEANVDDRFSQPGEDTWRPVEILTDALTILSTGFLDGAAEDTYIKARPGSSAATNTSYMNQSRPNAALTAVRENGSASLATSPSPVFVDRNGDSFGDFPARQPIRTEVAAANWTTLGGSVANRAHNSRAVPATENAFVNAVFIGGVVPNRVEQSNGGLHNFPRLLEDWNNRAVQIAGAFFQLNFATGSTGPFEHDAWQPGTNPTNSEQLGYYRAPARRWGYDPGLLYYPPAAAARRFISVGTPRSEYFRELPSDDPYITNLRCAERDVGGFVYNEGIRGTCPA